jgi:hypothetical protein
LPGVSPAVFGDALRRLSSSATYLYQDGPRFWYATQPTVTKLAEDRTELFKRDPDKIYEVLENRLRKDLRRTGEFNGIHPLPKSGADVPDDLETRLVVLSIDHAYNKEAKNAAELAANAIFESRGNSPRLYRNTLVFLAADKVRLQDLDEAICKFLAWDSILDEKEALNLDPHMVRQAETQLHTADSAVTARLPEVYQWLLVPEQLNPQTSVAWQAIRLTGNDALAERASKKLRSEELLLTAMGSTILRKHLDEIPLWRDERVTVKQLVEDFARYPYLPRLARPEVLMQAIRDGVGLLTWQSDTFAFAESFDEKTNRYLGLRAGQNISISIDSAGLLIKSQVAKEQIDVESKSLRTTNTVGIKEDNTNLAVNNLSGSEKEGTNRTRQKPKRFHGTITLDAERVGRDASRIADEVISNLSGQIGAKVKVTLEIEAFLPEGASEQTVRTVTENSRTLKFESHEFEQE